jgi:hypothetical protein
MLSALTTVESRWAMTRAVRFRETRSSADWISCSVAVSSADVASSRIRIGGALRMVRAMATRCFSPPESFSPRSPTGVLVAVWQTLDERGYLRHAGRFRHIRFRASQRP